ncbi:hypothetical protein BS17DRAFT_714845, partial [Gyrodon lividus]
RIGGTTDLLLAGVPPDVVKALGCWSSDIREMVKKGIAIYRIILYKYPTINIRIIHT